MSALKTGFHADVIPKNQFSCRRRSECRPKQSLKTRLWLLPEWGKRKKICNQALYPPGQKRQEHFHELLHVLELKQKLLYTKSGHCTRLGKIFPPLVGMMNKLAARQSWGHCCYFSVMSLIRQHSKKGNSVSSNAGVSERDFEHSKH